MTFAARRRPVRVILQEESLLRSEHANIFFEFACHGGSVVKRVAYQMREVSGSKPGRRELFTYFTFIPKSHVACTDARFGLRRFEVKMLEKSFCA